MADLSIIVINDFANTNGGASKVALSSALALAQKGYPVKLFSAVGPITPDLANDDLKTICLDQHEILKDPNRLRAIMQGIWNFRASRVLSEVLESSDPARTIIHLHSWSKALSSSVVKIANARGFKIICTLHDYFSACPNGGFFNYQDFKICDLRPLSLACLLKNCDARNYPQKIWRCTRQMVQQTVGLIPSGIHRFITVSDFSETILRPYLPVGSNIYRISNPVDIAQEKPSSVDKNTSFIFVGRLSKEKGANLLAEASRQMKCDVVFAGDGYYREEINRIYSGARITGWLSSKDVKTCLQSARALVFPSLLYETQGLVVLEAAALGVSAIVSDTSAAKDLVIDGVTGLWFKNGNVEDLTGKMSMLQNADMAKQMGQAAYENYWSNPSTMQNHVKQLEDTYKQVLGTKTDSPYLHGAENNKESKGNQRSMLGETTHENIRDYSNA